MNACAIARCRNRLLSIGAIAAGILACAAALAPRAVSADVHAVIATVERYPDSVLPGCARDGDRISGYLTGARHTPEPQIVRLKDSQATAQAIADALDRIAGQAEEGDWLVFYYSGHGFYVPDRDGDEGDGFDEALTPYDVKAEPGAYEIDGRQVETADGGGRPVRLTGGFILDDTIGEWADKAVARGLRVAVISDSCHSGTVSRGEFGAPVVEKAGTEFVARQFCLPAKNQTRGAAPRDSLDTSASMPRPRGAEGASDRAIGVTAKSAAKTGRLGMFACRPTQRSWGDARQGGAFTAALAKRLEQTPAPTLGDLSDWMESVTLATPQPQAPLMEVPAGMRDTVFLGEMKPPAPTPAAPTPGGSSGAAPTPEKTPAPATPPSPAPDLAALGIEFVRVDGGRAPFEIGATEITNAQYRAFIEANPQWRKDRISAARHDGDYLKEWNGMDFPAGAADVPVTRVSFPAARAFCEWIGARLPHEDEWERAALGPAGGASGRAIGVAPPAAPQQPSGGAPAQPKEGGLLYPWRGAWDPARCNSAEGGPGRLAPVRSMENGAVAWGDKRVYHLAGNAAEWCDELYADGRPVKGGSFLADRLGCIIGGVIDCDPRLCAEDVGFRPAR
ncbi:MAG: caspase family protein [Candidatus Sumerlaeota bacterium]|nr:caspase family protein [Candidatus Sumerlaeota bacterium]